MRWGGERRYPGMPFLHTSFPGPQLLTRIHVLLGSSAGHLGIESWSS